MTKHNVQGESNKSTTNWIFLDYFKTKIQNQTRSKLRPWKNTKYVSRVDLSPLTVNTPYEGSMNNLLNGSESFICNSRSSKISETKMLTSNYLLLTFDPIHVIYFFLVSFPSLTYDGNFPTMHCPWNYKKKHLSFMSTTVPQKSHLQGNWFDKWITLKWWHLLRKPDICLEIYFL